MFIFFSDDKQNLHPTVLTDAQGSHRRHCS